MDSGDGGTHGAARMVAEEIDSFEHRLAHGAVYSGGGGGEPAPRRAPPAPSQQAAGRAGAAPRRAVGGVAAGAAGASGGSGALAVAMAVGGETPGEADVPDAKAERRGDVALVRNLPSYGNDGSDSD